MKMIYMNEYCDILARNLCVYPIGYINMYIDNITSNSSHTSHVPCNYHPS